MEEAGRPVACQRKLQNVQELIPHRHPYRRMVARPFKRTDLPVDAGAGQAAPELAAQENVVEAKAGVALPAVAAVVPESEELLFRVDLAQCVEPALIDKAPEGCAAFRLDEGVSS